MESNGLLIARSEGWPGQERAAESGRHEGVAWKEVTVMADRLLIRLSWVNSFSSWPLAEGLLQGLCEFN